MTADEMMEKLGFHFEGGKCEYHNSTAIFRNKATKVVFYLYTHDVMVYYNDHAGCISSDLLQAIYQVEKELGWIPNE